MAHPTRLTLAGLFLGFLLFVSPSEANKCKTGCHGVHTNKPYQEGRTYTYQLNGESVTSVSEAEGEATFKLNAIVELAVKPDCVHQIRLKNVKINGASASQGEIERHALQFNYHNGHIDTEVCAEAGDTQAALNVKRAVISLFQHAVVQDDGSTTHHETDVFGGCPTDFSFSKSGASQTIKKSRNLEQCSFRENIKQDLISATFNLNAGVKSTPLLTAEQQVEQQFDRGILKKASSVETYKFKPFSNGDAGAKTVVETTLTFRGESGGSSPASVSEPKSLIFEAPHQTVMSSVDAITRALHATKESMHGAVTPSAARRFAELIKVLRQSSKADILTIYSHIKAGAGFDKDATRKVFLDALFRTGTGEAAEALVELVKRNDLTSMETIIYYTSLGFVRHANLDSVTTVTSLLDQPELPRVAYLGIGSLIGKYCQEHSCENVPQVNAALAKITSKATANAKSRKQEDNVISALKGLGNARYLDDATLIKIAKIATAKNVHNRVRIAALEALPTRCSMKWKNEVASTLADRDEDSEIRIKAYLSLVSCPCPHVANKLKEILDKETINQVGSFITSHLRNLRASTNPDKEEAKRQLGLIKPRTKFPEDFRKFSFNNELSYTIDSLGIGSSVESNVIYSQNSFVPRSANLNLTTQIFGHSFNFLELEGRVENMDKLIEKYLGPKGILRPSKLKDTVIDGGRTIENIVAQIKNRFNNKVGRHARSVNVKDVDNFIKRVHLPETELNDDLELDLSIKLFGAQLAFLSYQGDENKISAESVVDQILNILESGIDKAKHFDYHFKHHIHFLDAELVYPTGLGFPLTLGVTGTTAVHLKTSGKIDLVAIYKNPESAAIQLALEPSAAIRIAGSLVVEGYGIESGLKVITTLHTATGTDISVKLLNGNGVDINVGVPVPKQELISVTSEVLISSGAKGDNYVAPKFAKGQDHSDCFDQLANLVGFTICGKVSYPYDSLASVQKKPLFPLSGPASFSVYLESNDVRTYHFKAYYNTANPKARSVEILLETPNSRTNRRVSLLLEGAIEPEKVLRLTFDSPWKKASAEALLKNRANEQTLTLTLHHDNIEYFIRTGIVSSGNKYRPVLEYRVPDHVEKLAGIKNGAKTSQRGGQQYTVGGVIDVSKNNNGKKYIFEKVSLASGGQSIISIDGTVSATSNSGNADLKIEYGGDSLVLKGNAAISGPVNYKADVSVIPTQNKDHGFSLSIESKGTDSAGEQTLIFVHGKDLNSQTNRFTYYGKHSVKYESADNFDISVERKITYPVVGLVVHIESELSPKKLGYELEFKYAKFVLESESFVKTGMAKPGDFLVQVGVKFQSNNILFRASRAVISNHKNKFVTLLELQPGGKYEIEAEVEYDVKPENINTKLDAELKVNGKKIIIDLGLEVNPNKVNSRAIVSAQDTKYVEFVLTLQRGSNPHGDLKLNLKNYLTATGQFQYQRESGNAKIEINIPKFNRKVTGQGDLSVVGSKHVANLEILYDASKDPKKRIKFSSDSDITKTSFDTKNVLEILDYKTVVNGKGSFQGETYNGRQNVEFDITLPCGRYIVGKANRAVTTKNELMDGQMQFELIDHVSKGGKSRKIIYHPEVRSLNVKEYTFAAEHALKLINFNGDDLNILLGLKNLPNGADKKSVELKFSVDGSKVPSKFSLQLEGDHENEGAYGSGKIRSSLGNNLSLEGNGKFIRGNNVDKPHAIEGEIEIKLPSEKLKSIKYELSDTILIPAEVGGRFEVIEKSQLTYNNDKTIKCDSHFTSVGIADDSHSVEGSGKMTLTVHNNSPITVGYTYKHNPINELKESAVSFNLNYGNKQTSIALDSTYNKNLEIFNLNVKATTPIEKIRNVDVKLQHKGSAVEGTFRIPSSGKTDIIVTADQVKYTLTTEQEISEQKFNGHIIFTSPDGKIEQIVKFNKLGEKEFKGEFKLSCPDGFIDLDGHLNIASVDDFFIIVNFDSDRLKTRKIHAEIANKPAKGAKRIQITITSNGKNIISGSTNYKKHSEGGKVTVEGNGSLRVKENQQTSSFKYTHHQLSTDVDGEKGVATRVNFNFGQSSVVGEFKITNKEVHILNSYCEQNADCAQFKLQSKVNNAEFKRTDETTLEVDLRKFNVPYEFGLKSTEVFDLQSGYDNTANLYLHSSKDNSQYSYHVYAHPTESGITITLPSRELALIGSIDIPKNKRAGAYKGDISFWLDRKRNPKEKTSLTVTGDVVFDKNSGSLQGETKLTYPSQTKDLSVKSKVHFGGAHLLDANIDIDIFAKRNQKIVVAAKVVKTQLNQGYNITGTYSVTSSGQQLNVVLEEHVAVSRNEIGFGSFLSYTDEHRKPKSTGILFSANLQEAHLLIRSPDQDLVKADSVIDVTKNLQKVHTDVAVFGREPITVDFEVKDLNSFKYIYQVKNNPNNRLEASGRVVIGQLAEVHADSFKDGAKKELFHFLLHLDERRYLKPEFAFNKDNFAQVIDSYRGRIIELAKLTDKFVEELVKEIVTELKDLLEHLQKAKPNLKPLLDHYVAQLNKIKDELNIETEGFKQLQAKIKATFSGPIAAITEALKTAHERWEELCKLYSDLMERLSAAFKEVLPELQKSWRAISNALTAVIEELVKIASTKIKIFADIFNAHKEEFKQIADIASELVRDIATIVLKASTKIQTEVNDFFTVLVAEVKALPIYEFIQAKYKQLTDLNLTNAAVAAVDEVVETIKQFLPTKQLQDLLASIHRYIVAHIKQEKVDDVRELKKLYSYTLQAIQSIIELIQSRAGNTAFIDAIETRIPFDFRGWSRLPVVSTIKVSALSLLRNREWPSLTEVFYSYRPTLNPPDLIPPFSKFAVFLDGGHFFTFDGRHLTLPGKCTYVLAQDARDGNFSIVADFDNGKLISVTVTELTESITYESTGAILVNNKPAEFPADTKNLHASLHNPLILISSEYGVKLHCSRKAPLICSVHVSGFYHGRLRGILGNGNNEPWDDFTLPSGKVTENEGDFGNAFKLNTGCASVRTPDHSSHQHDSTCTEFFTGNSPLSSCFNYVNPGPYRQACDHAASAGAKKEGACLIATAYYAVCEAARVSVKVPTTCGSCQIGNQKINIGDSFSVQHPKQQADIIFVLEQATENSKVLHEMIVPLIPIIKAELKENGITDVHIGLIGFGDQLEWPQHYTYKGSSNIDGDVKNIKFWDKQPIITMEEAKTGDIKKKLQFLAQKVETEIGPIKLTEAYEEALGYDFRPGASKTIVGVLATPCEKSVLPISLQQLRLLLGYKAYSDLGLTYHQISALDDILISGKAVKNVVGFDSDSVFTFADSKRKPIEGSSEMKNNMVLASGDVCAIFAATSGGASFSAHNYFEAKANQKKQFLQVTGRRLVSSLISTEIREDCVCRQQYGVYPTSECKIVSRKEKEQIAKPRKGVKG